MGPGLSSWSSSPVNRNSITAGAREELSPAQIRHEEITNFSVLKSRRPSRLYIEERLLGGQKGNDVNLPIGLFARIYFG